MLTRPAEGNHWTGGRFLSGLAGLSLSSTLSADVIPMDTSIPSANSPTVLDNWSLHRHPHHLASPIPFLRTQYAHQISFCQRTLAYHGQASGVPRLVPGFPSLVTLHPSCSTRDIIPWSPRECWIVASCVKRFLFASEPSYWPGDMHTLPAPAAEPGEFCSSTCSSQAMILQATSSTPYYWPASSV